MNKKLINRIIPILPVILSIILAFIVDFQNKPTRTSDIKPVLINSVIAIFTACITIGVFWMGFLSLREQKETETTEKNAASSRSKSFYNSILYVSLFSILLLIADLIFSFYDINICIDVLFWAHIIFYSLVFGAFLYVYLNPEWGANFLKNKNKQ